MRGFRSVTNSATSRWNRDALRSYIPNRRRNSSVDRVAVEQRRSAALRRGFFGPFGPRNLHSEPTRQTSRFRRDGGVGVDVFLLQDGFPTVRSVAFMRAVLGHMRRALRSSRNPSGAISPRDEWMSGRSGTVTAEQLGASAFTRGFVGPCGPKTSHSDTTTSAALRSETFVTLEQRRPSVFSRDVIVSLNLQSFGLQGHLPPTIRCFHTLQTLNLSRNRLMSLPAEIGALRSLVKLSVSHNRLEILPDVCALTSLTHLDVSHNRLERLHGAVGALVSLTHLDVSHNKLYILPAAMGALVSLTHLDASFNPMMYLQPEIGALVALTKLNVSHNKLRCLPDEICALVSLTHLDVSYNRLEALPAGIGDLSSLVDLNVSVNDLESLPYGIGRLASLVLLNASQNHLVELPYICLSELPRLENLILSHNRLRVIPELGICNVVSSALRVLDLRRTLVQGPTRGIGRPYSRSYFGFMHRMPVPHDIAISDNCFRCLRMLGVRVLVS